MFCDEKYSCLCQFLKEPEADKNKIPNAEASTFLDPVDAAVRSIMGPGTPLYFIIWFKS